MNKQELMDAIYELDPSYVKMNIDLSQYTEEQLQICYDRKKHAPISKKGGWYSRFRPQYNKEKQEQKDENPKLSSRIVLSGFDALDKEKL